MLTDFIECFAGGFSFSEKTFLFLKKYVKNQLSSLKLAGREF
jgi:hypothetical protein